jgi:hypothetical protein
MMRTVMLLATLVMAVTRPVWAEKTARTFPSPEAAGAALVLAFETNDDQALRDVLGPGSDDIVQSGSDPLVAASRKDLATAGKRKLAVDRSVPGRAILQFGDDGWPLPVPIVEKEGIWYFDAPAGREEILARSIGKNELRAIGLCDDYLDAQAAYASEDRDGNDVRQYAEHLISTPGKHDGLYWDDPDGDDPSPLDVALGDLANPTEGPSYGGYVWRILTAQGANAPGGAYSYIINGNMIAGAALVGTPVQYRKTGVMTLLVSTNGIVYEKDLGPESLGAAKAMTTFDPDASWIKVGPAEESEAQR